MVAFLKNLSFCDLKDLTLCRTKENCPKSLIDFLATVKALSVPHEKIEINDIAYCFGVNCGLSIKKRHEIISLAPVVADVCGSIGSQEVIDIGAGLGYLSYLLAENHNYSVLAIEGSKEKIDSALGNQNSHHQSSKENITFLHHFITNDSQDEIERAINKHFKISDRVCICGLHACADLSITILELFLKIKQVKSLVIMPCCYHRLKLEKEIDGRNIFQFSSECYVEIKVR
ncbi:hypothetical protein HHI36_000938 [Cryptolaemus montrouzieri]|uniref:Methyltransferase domain-containing protein n=1 Tax=Cryptolaemus montrouzieri TaxID=559131 RepID=A0ABD2P7F2_9CUCU